MKIVDTGISTEQFVRADLVNGDVFCYDHPDAKPGLRMACANPKDRDGFFSVRLEDGELMHSAVGSTSAEEWPVVLINGVYEY